MKLSKGEKIFSIANVIIMAAFIAVIMVPLLFVVKKSFDVGGATPGLSLIPKKVSLVYYKMILTNKGIYKPFMNSAYITIVGTILSVFLEALGAYALSKRDLPGHKIFTYMILITMMFSGGLVPLYLVVKGLGLIDKLSALIIPSCVSAWNIILIRNYYFSIPESLVEAAKIDGAQEHTVFFRIILPLSMPIMATIALFTGVGYWNTFFNSVIFINSPTKFTFPVKLYEMIVVQEQMIEKFDALAGNAELMRQNLNAEGVSSAMIIVSLIPVIIAYPFLQKHFVKGIMVGSIKG
jgi:putative aldouronate transport system permease protein